MSKAWSSRKEWHDYESEAERLFFPGISHATTLFLVKDGEAWPSRSAKN
jgi:hypothetical protein